MNSSLAPPMPRERISLMTRCPIPQGTAPLDVLVAPPLDAPVVVVAPLLFEAVLPLLDAAALLSVDAVDAAPPVPPGPNWNDGYPQLAAATDAAIRATSRGCRIMIPPAYIDREGRGAPAQRASPRTPRRHPQRERRVAPAPGTSAPSSRLTHHASAMSTACSGSRPHKRTGGTGVTPSSVRWFSAMFTLAGNTAT